MFRWTLNLFAAATLASTLLAQSAVPTYVVTTIAGSGPTGDGEGRNRGDGGPATEARLETPGYLQFDTKGNLYVSVRASGGSTSVRRIDRSGKIESEPNATFPMTVAPDGALVYHTWRGLIGIRPDGTVVDPYLTMPTLSSFNATSIVVNRAGDVYVGSYNGLRLFEKGDDRYRSVTMPYDTSWIASDATGRIYAYGRSGIHRLEADRTFTLISPRPTTSFYDTPGSVDGPAGRASIGYVNGVTFDTSGNLFFTEWANAARGFTCKVRRMTPDRSIATIAGGDYCRLQGEGGPGLQAGFLNPIGITIDSDGNLYVSDSVAHRVFKLTRTAPLNTRMTVNGVAHAASFQLGEVAPGTVFTLFGSEIGPASLTTMTVESNRATTALGGVRILFDGVPAPLLYVSARQASGVAPYGLSGRRTTKVTVEYGGFRSAPFEVAVVDAKPALFTVDSSGQGAAAAINQDGSINSADKPAAAGSVAVLYATGLGLMDASVEDGAITGSTLAAPQQPVTVTIGGRTAQVLYAGSAPGLIAGLSQINVVIPEGLDSREVRIQVGQALSPRGVFLYTK